MSVTINGTSGVTTPGIANSEGYTGDGLTIAAGAPAGALQIDSAGNFGLGVAPSAWSSMWTAQDFKSASSMFAFNTTTDPALISGVNVYVDGSSSITNAKYKVSSEEASMYRQYQGVHSWHTAPSGTAGNPITFTQAMTLDTSGNLLVGTTSVDSGNISGFTVTKYAGGSYTTVGHNTGAFSGHAYSVFYYNGVEIGSIKQNGTTGVSYSTSSDYRLKENVAPLTNALDKISALKPVTYNWKADGSADRGFIAHELQEVIPQAVSGEKDAVDDEGNIKPQGVDYGKITPELVAAIQEQQAMITELKARIEQLEAK